MAPTPGSSTWRAVKPLSQVLHFAWANKWAVRSGDWKLISTFDAKTKSPNLWLHNLAESKPEVNDHAREQPELVKELAALHEAWEKELASK